MAEITKEEIYLHRTILLQLAFAAADRKEKKDKKAAAKAAAKAASAKAGLKFAFAT